MGLAASFDEILPSAGIDPNSGLASRRAHGIDSSLTVATFPGGYHSRPHAHESEEVSQLLVGELSILMDGTEFRLSKGDFIRIPALKVHWKWNRSSQESVMFEMHCGASDQPNSHPLLDPIERKDSSFANNRGVQFGRTYAAGSFYADRELEFRVAASDNPLWMRDAGLEWGIMRPAKTWSLAGGGKSRTVGGERMSMLLTEREGLHTQPHFHASEQISYIVEGELWTFVEGRAYLSRAGDFLRVPGNAVHWAKVDPGKVAKVIESQAPLKEDPVVTHKAAVYLVPKHRLPQLPFIGGSIPVQVANAEDMDALEAKMAAAALETQKGISSLQRLK